MAAPAAFRFSTDEQRKVVRLPCFICNQTYPDRHYYCHRCGLVPYCSEAHRREHWTRLRDGHAQECPGPSGKIYQDETAEVLAFMKRMEGPERANITDEERKRFADYAPIAMSELASAAESVGDAVRNAASGVTKGIRRRMQVLKGSIGSLTDLYSALRDVIGAPDISDEERRERASFASEHMDAMQAVVDVLHQRQLDPDTPPKRVIKPGEMTQTKVNEIHIDAFLRRQVGQLPTRLTFYEAAYKRDPVKAEQDMLTTFFPGVMLGPRQRRGSTVPKDNNNDGTGVKDEDDTGGGIGRGGGRNMPPAVPPPRNPPPAAPRGGAAGAPVAYTTINIAGIEWSPEDMINFYIACAKDLPIGMVGDNMRHPVRQVFRVLSWLNLDFVQDFFFKEFFLGYFFRQQSGLGDFLTLERGYTSSQTEANFNTFLDTFWGAAKKQAIGAEGDTPATRKEITTAFYFFARRDWKWTYLVHFAMHILVELTKFVAVLALGYAFSFIIDDLVPILRGDSPTAEPIVGLEGFKFLEAYGNLTDTADVNKPDSATRRNVLNILDEREKLMGLYGKTEVDAAVAALQKKCDTFAADLTTNMNFQNRNFKPTGADICVNVMVEQSNLEQRRRFGFLALPQMLPNLFPSGRVVNDADRVGIPAVFAKIFYGFVTSTFDPGLIAHTVLLGMKTGGDGLQMIVGYAAMRSILCLSTFASRAVSLLVSYARYEPRVPHDDNPDTTEEVSGYALFETAFRVPRNMWQSGQELYRLISRRELWKVYDFGVTQRFEEGKDNRRTSLLAAMWDRLDKATVMNTFVDLSLLLVAYKNNMLSFRACFPLFYGTYSLTCMVGYGVVDHLYRPFMDFFSRQLLGVATGTNLLVSAAGTSIFGLVFFGTCYFLPKILSGLWKAAYVFGKVRNPGKKREEIESDNYAAIGRFFGSGSQLAEIGLHLATNPYVHMLLTHIIALFLGQSVI